MENSYSFSQYFRGNCVYRRAYIYVQQYECGHASARFGRFQCEFDNFSLCARSLAHIVKFMARRRRFWVTKIFHINDDVHKIEHIFRIF